MLSLDVVATHDARHYPSLIISLVVDMLARRLGDLHDPHIYMCSSASLVYYTFPSKQLDK